MTYVSFQEETRENVTVSDLSFVPTTDDDGKSITCRAENPNITGAFLESSWKIDVVCKSQLYEPNLRLFTVGTSVQCGVQSSCLLILGF
jgi:hypothetical protein